METLESITQIELENILEKFSKSVETSDDEEKLVFYVWEELYNKNGYKPTDEEIHIRMKDLCAGYIVRKMTEKGLFEPYFDPDGEEDTFELTELGKKVQEKL